MTILIIVIVAIILIAYLINASNKQLKYEVVKEGGLLNIFYNLEQALLEEDFFLYQDNVTTLEFHNKINNYSFLQLKLKKNFEIQNPYQMQMSHILEGKVNQKTMPYIVTPHLTTEQFREALVRMLKELLEKQANSILTK
ncbi:MAG: hypothetical protein ACO1G5_01035 [Bacteroidota bacterium]